MADVHFTCPACEQSLVADAKGAGLTIDCPHCTGSLQIPAESTVSSEARARKSLSKWINRATALEGELSAARRKFEETEREYSEQRVLFAETAQRLRAAAAENECLQSQVAEERARCEAMEEDWHAAQAAAAAMQQMLSESENERQQLDLGIQQARMELDHARKHLALVSAERNDLLVDAEQTKSALVETLAELDSARREAQETGAILRRAQTELARAREQLETLERDYEKASSQHKTSAAELKRSQRTLATVTKERDRLRSDLGQNSELTNFLAVKSERDRLEKEVRDMQSAAADAREKMDALETERNTLRSESRELKLQLAALRDSHSDGQLAQDNEVLRRLVERLNEELKERGPAPRKGRKGEPASRVAEAARSLWARCMVSDPDVT